MAVKHGRLTRQMQTIEAFIELRRTRRNTIKAMADGREERALEVREKRTAADEVDRIETNKVSWTHYPTRLLLT